MIREIMASSALTRSRIPVASYTINPFVGCTVGCKYCFARFIGAFKYTGGLWGRDVGVKRNIAELLRREVNSLGKVTVFLSSTCDPYQHIEEKYGLTREMLVTLISHRIPIFAMSKSTLIRRDVDLFKLAGEEARVLVSITTDREDVRKLLEPGSSSFEERLKTIDFLRKNGVDAGAFVGPVLPMNAERVSEELARRGATVHLDALNYISQVRQLYLKMGWESWLYREKFEEVKAVFERRLTVE
ncbi:MAG: radical SAM protein [Mesotoga sp.]